VSRYLAELWLFEFEFSRPCLKRSFFVAVSISFPGCNSLHKVFVLSNLAIIMLRNTIYALILVMLALGIADARMPQIGDQVNITMPGGEYSEWYEGKIVDMGDGLICLNVTGSSMDMPRSDVCVGVGAIIGLTWL
jgi:hypothetical protein